MSHGDIGREWNVSEAGEESMSRRREDSMVSDAADLSGKAKTRN